MQQLARNHMIQTAAKIKQTMKAIRTAANPQAAMNMMIMNNPQMKQVMEIVNQSGAQIVGIGAAVEKGFQPGGQKLRDAGYHLESLAIIESADPEKGIVFRGE